MSRNSLFLMRKYITLLLLLFILVIYQSAFVYSASQTISIVENPEPTKEDFSIGKFFKRYWVFILVGFLLVFGLIFLLIYIINKIKEGRDVWYQVWKHKKHLSKIHRDKWRLRAFFRYSKNNPIRIIYHEGGQVFTKVIGYYKGHYTSHEGNITMMFNCRRKWLIFPRSDLLILNTRAKMTIYEKKEVDKGTKKEIIRDSKEIDLPYDFVTFGQSEIIIYAYAIDMDIRTNFYYPVLKDKDGNIINMFFPTYENMKQVVIESYLFDQTDDFVKVAKKSIDLNPLIRGHNKVLDNSSSIETQESSIKK